MSAVATALDDVAAVAQRLAVLLAAGIAPERAWGFVEARWAASGADDGEAAPDAAGVGVGDYLACAARAAARADDVAVAIRAECAAAPRFGLAHQRAVAWGLFAATWAVAVRSGAPLAATLQGFASGIRHAAALHRELEVAFSGPRSTARLVGALPLVALGFGLLMGFDTVHALTATPIGWGCLAGGLGLMIASRRWSARLLAAAEPSELAPGLEPELVAVAMGSGASVGRARGLVASALDDFAPFVRELGGAADTRAVDAVVALAESAGVPTAGLLRAEAERRRADADAAGRAAAASVAVRLTVPLAVCVLPAFMLLGVVPVLVALFAGSGIGFG
ncbi:MAG: hypothetical protein FWD85_04010 [Microbacteriaceae bacterium]|nr:hypothetical protein [Microbacteriaceae bacterium]MCL2794453.1 hypothetical protein [Microbacteriaceae bacterium]